MRALCLLISAFTAFVFGGCTPSLITEEISKTPTAIHERIDSESVRFENLYIKVRGAVVKVMGCLKAKDTGELGEETHLGSGVIIFGNKVLTARHVVEAKTYDGSQYVVTAVLLPIKFNKEGTPTQWKRYEVKSFKISDKETSKYLNKDTDLALLYLDAGNERLPYVDMARENPKIGSQVFTVGFPLSMELVLTTGVVSQYREISYWDPTWSLDNPVYCVGYDAATAPGSSGGPIFDTKGRLVAIHVAGITVYAGYYWGVPISSVRDFIRG